MGISQIMCDILAEGSSQFKHQICSSLWMTSYNCETGFLVVGDRKQVQ